MKIQLTVTISEKKEDNPAEVSLSTIVEDIQYIIKDYLYDNGIKAVIEAEAREA